jgi:hypothetical protein
MVSANQNHDSSNRTHRNSGLRKSASARTIHLLPCLLLRRGSGVRPGTMPWGSGLHITDPLRPTYNEVARTRLSQATAISSMLALSSSLSMHSRLVPRTET